MRWAGWMTLALLALAGCNKSPVEPTVGSETHWLRTCDADAACGDEAACVCGICTVPCGQTACDVAGEGAVCVAADDPAASALCGALPAAATGICARGCEGDAECGADMRCDTGVCVPVVDPADPAPQRISQRTSTPGPLALDMLFVVDNSGSMCQEQVALNTAFAEVVGALVGVDYRIAVTSTDLADPAHGGRFLASPSPPVPSLNCRDANDEPIIPDTEGCDAFLAEFEDPALIRPGAVADAEALKKWFRCLTTLGTSGDGFERGIGAALRATRCDGPNAERFGACCGPDGFDPRCDRGPDAPDFLRPEAILAVVFITDENDCTAGVDAPWVSQFPVCRSLDDGDGDGVPDGYAEHCGGDVGAAACYANDCGEQTPEACAEALCVISRAENSNCEWDRDRLVPIDAASEALTALKRDPNDVTIWSFVGEELRLQSGEPLRFNPGEPSMMCMEDPADLEACCPDGQCIGRIEPSCESELGAAFSGYRYAELAGTSTAGCGPDEGCSMCSGSIGLAERFESFATIRHSACLTARPACLVGAELRPCATAEEFADTANFALQATADGEPLVRDLDWELDTEMSCPSGLVFRLLEPDFLPPNTTIELVYTR